MPPAPAAPAGAAAPPRTPDLRVGALDLAALAGRGPGGWLRRIARGKRWIYLVAASDEVLAAVAVVEAGWFGGGFAWALDRATGAVAEASAAGLAGTARVDGGLARARLRGRGLAISIARDGSAWRATAAGPALALDLALEAAGAPAPFDFVTAVPGGGVRATQKAAALPAAGRVHAGGRTLALEGGTGGVDRTGGLLARETAWRWAFGTGRAGGTRLGFNLCEGFGVPAADPGENAGFAGAPYPLPPVTFAVGDATSPWRVRDATGAVDLLFRPAGAHREARNLGLVRTRFTQVGGTFDGRIPGPDGGAVAVAGLPGVVEDHWARW